MELVLEAQFHIQIGPAHIGHIQLLGALDEGNVEAVAAGEEAVAVGVTHKRPCVESGKYGGIVSVMEFRVRAGAYPGREIQGVAAHCVGVETHVEEYAHKFLGIQPYAKAELMHGAPLADDP